MMPIFERKPTRVEAFQMAPGAALPPFIEKAIREQLLSYSTQNGVMYGSVYNHATKANLTFMEGDYIVNNGPDDLYVVGKEQFQKTYTAVKDEKKEESKPSSAPSPAASSAPMPPAKPAPAPAPAPTAKPSPAPAPAPAPAPTAKPSPAPAPAPAPTAKPSPAQPSPAQAPSQTPASTATEVKK